MFFSFTLCTISIAIIKTTHIMTACLSPPPLHHCPDHATVTLTVIAVLTGFSESSSIAQLWFANFKLSLKPHAAEVRRGWSAICIQGIHTCLAATWVVCRVCGPQSWAWENWVSVPWKSTWVADIISFYYYYRNIEMSIYRHRFLVNKADRWWSVSLHIFS